MHMHACVLPDFRTLKAHAVCVCVLGTICHVYLYTYTERCVHDVSCNHNCKHTFIQIHYMYICSFCLGLIFLCSTEVVHLFRCAVQF